MSSRLYWNSKMSLLNRKWKLTSEYLTLSFCSDCGVRPSSLATSAVWGTSENTRPSWSWRDVTPETRSTSTWGNAAPMSTRLRSKNKLWQRWSPVDVLSLSQQVESSGDDVKMWQEKLMPSSEVCVNGPGTFPCDALPFLTWCTS